MPDRHAAVSHLHFPHHARRLLTGHRALRVTALVLTGVVVFGFSAAAAVGQRLNHNIDQFDVTNLLGDPMPTDPSIQRAEPTGPVDPSDPNAGQAINILVLGSDQRDGHNAVIGGSDSGGRNSDTAIVLHISANRDRVEAVSIPRDSLVDIPACLGSNGKKSYPQHNAMFNSAYGTGWELGGDVASAAACAGRTVQNDTGLTINHLVVVDFTGFQTMVNAIGGVNICIPRPLHDSYTHLNLQAGQQVLNGTQALQLARARHGNIGNGGDLDRIGNQQRLIAAIANQVLSANVLANPTKLLSFLDAATKSLHVDSGLSLSTMAGIAYSLHSIRANDITFMTIPTATAPSDPNRLVWTSAAKTVWADMVADRPIAGAGTSTAAATPTAAPGTASGTGGTAGTASGVTNTSNTVTTTVPAGSTAVAPPTATPAPAQTKVAGQQPFTPADVTAVCS